MYLFLFIRSNYHICKFVCFNIFVSPVFLLLLLIVVIVWCNQMHTNSKLSPRNTCLTLYFQNIYFSKTKDKIIAVIKSVFLKKLIFFMYDDHWDQTSNPISGREISSLIMFRHVNVTWYIFALLWIFKVGVKLLK